MTYQWYKDGAALENEGCYTGVDTPRLHIGSIITAYEGTYTCLITNDYGSATSNDAVLTVGTSSGLPVVVTTTSLPDGAVGAPYSQTLAATGTTPISWYLIGELPTGLTLSLSTGIISGMPTTADTFHFIVRAENTWGIWEQSLSITINDTLLSASPAEYTFPAATAGYDEQAAQEFTIGIVGTGAITGLSAVLTDGTGFEISEALSADSLSTGDTATVSVRPVTGLSVGPYTDTLTIAGSGGVSTTISLSFTVNAAPVAPTITGPTALTLPEGYSATSTGEYTITGTEPVTVTKTSGDANITWNDTAKKLDITAGLAPGSYPVILEASNGTSPDATLTFTLTVSVAPTYSISISPNGKAFTNTVEGYSEQTAQEFTITNTGTGTITGLHAQLSGIFFEISDALSANTLASGETATVSVRPKNGLSAYTYGDTLTITGSNDISHAVSLSFTVNAPVTLLTAAADGASGTTTSTKIDLTFDVAITGLTAGDITITSGTGSATKGALTGSGTNWSIATSNVSEGTVTVAVASPSGYAVSGSPKTVNVYAAPPATYTATVSPTSKTFTAATEGYGQQAAQEFTITNTGSGTITGLSAALGGGSTSDFEISAALSANSLASGNTATVSVRPKTGLAANAAPYTDTLTITGDNGISISIGLSFTVNAATSTDKTLVSITAPSDITGVANGAAKTAAALGLPSTVTLVTNDGSVQASVTWAVYGCSYDPSVTTEQAFTVDGTVTLPSGVVNTNSVSLDVIISVTVNAAISTDKTLVSIVPPSAITGVTNGTAKTASALGLPGTVTLVTGGGNVSASMSWDVASSSYDVSSSSAQTFTVNGTVTLPAGVINPDNVSLSTSISVTVNAGSNGGGGNNDGGGGGGGGTPSTPSTPDYRADVDAGNGSDTTLPVTVDKNSGNAGVDVGTVSDLMSGGKTTVVTVPSVPDVDTYTLGVPVPNLTTPDEQGEIVFKTNNGSVTIPYNMLTGVAGISASKAQISIGEGDKTTLPAGLQDLIGDRPLIQLTLSIDGKQTNWSNPNASVTVSIPYTPTAAELANPESIVIWYIDGSGNVVTIPNGHYNPSTGMVTFQTTHFSDYAVAYNKVSFKDVASSAWYDKAVSFIAAREITSSTGNGNYSPEAKLTRGEFIVMMMRAYGIALDANPTDNFSDAGNTYYTGYLAAAKRLGITTGVGNNMYAPGKEINRQEMFTLLYNALKVIGQLPQGSSGKTLSDFSDAGQVDAWANDPMTLLVESGTVGGNAGKLSPTSTTTRAEMAQVLYNLLGK